ncbi:L-iditol 2-dehydrogenase [Thiofilum flexile]|uniref:L-iditol 2-dehydrogenase n=1 Tax=Thiofilum flexile TaxID=125627 RepID=UPI0003657401|nr:L-iditol 2-dehydrogenase [Thiofilum flexile]
MSLQRLKGKHALVTGANGGIGLATTEAFLKEGAICSAIDLPAQPSAELQALAEQYPQLHYHSLNVVDTTAVKALITSLNQQHGVINVLFNNAAVFDMAPLLESHESMYDKIFAVNVKGMFFVMQAVLEGLIDAGHTGSIINLASQAGRRGEALVSHYCASKAAVISYTQSAALAMAPYGIRVNGIAPGVIDTPMWAHVDGLFAKYEGLAKGEKKIAVGKAVPLGRMGIPADVAGAAVFLASDESAYITAQTLNVDGGNVMS